MLCWGYLVAGGFDLLSGLSSSDGRSDAEACGTQVPSQRQRGFKPHLRRDHNFIQACAETERRCYCPPGVPTVHLL